MESPSSAGLTLDLTTPVEAEDTPPSLHALTILHHPDPRRVGERALLRELAAGRPAKLSREAPLFNPPGHASGAPLAEECVSRSPMRVEALEGGGVRVAIAGSRTSLVHRGETVRDRLDLPPDAVERGAVLRLGGAVVLLLHQAASPVAASAETLGLLGESDGIRRVRQDIERAAALDVPVLIRGETGTGKELVARAIQRAGARRDAPFVAINLGAVPATLAAAELFGSERGAFTGAGQPRPGYFEAARGGTLFLDEVGEASPEVQVLLLRALETGEIQRVGAARPLRMDTRILAATDADLAAKIRDGSFRAPLLHRLSAYEIALPPLRERRDDIARLLLAFLRDELRAVGAEHRLAPRAAEGRTWLPASLVVRLIEHSWPGNVRQLRNVARQLAISCHGKERAELDPASLRQLDEATRSGYNLNTFGPPRVPASEPPPARASEPPRVPASEPPPGPSARRRPSDVTEEELLSALRACRWDMAAAAARLRISRPSLYARIDESPRLHTAADLTAEQITGCHDACGGDLDRMVDALQISEMALRRRLRELGLPFVKR